MPEDRADLPPTYSQRELAKTGADMYIDANLERPASTAGQAIWIALELRRRGYHSKGIRADILGTAIEDTFPELDKIATSANDKHREYGVDAPHLLATDTIDPIKEVFQLAEELAGAPDNELESLLTSLRPPTNNQENIIAIAVTRALAKRFQKTTPSPES